MTAHVLEDPAGLRGMVHGEEGQRHVRIGADLSGHLFAGFPHSIRSVHAGGKPVRGAKLAGDLHRGKAAGIPPSTGSTAPVVGVAREAKKSTARPTSRAVTRRLRRFRCT